MNATPSSSDSRPNRPLTEVRLEIARLSPADRARLVKAAHSLAHGLPEEPEDLVQEALVRTISGRRKCPVRMAIPAFLFGVMRSLASAARKRGEALRFVPLDEGVVLPSARSPGAGERLRAMRRRLLALFDAGSPERRLVELMLEGRRGLQLREPMGYTPTQLATARRRIRRRLERAKRRGMS